MALTKVNTGGLALDAVDNTILKLDDNYALTGTVTGTDAENSIIHASTTTNRTVNGASSWIDHLSVTFTNTKVTTLQCFGQFAHGHETGACMMQGRFDLDGSSQSEALQIFKQGFQANMSFGSHNMIGFFHGVSAGSHTIKLQVRNAQSSTSGILNYFDDANNGDHIWVLYK